MGYIAYQLTKNSKSELLSMFKPSFSNVVCHHVTYKFGVQPTLNLPRHKEGYIVGYKKSSGIEAFVVEINGSIYRPDGRLYHITFSHDDKHKPVHSNILLSDGKYSDMMRIKIKFNAGYFK